MKPRGLGLAKKHTGAGNCVSIQPPKHQRIKCPPAEQDCPFLKVLPYRQEQQQARRASKAAPRGGARERESVFFAEQQEAGASLLMPFPAVTRKSDGAALSQRLCSAPPAECEEVTEVYRERAASAACHTACQPKKEEPEAGSCTASGWVLGLRNNPAGFLQTETPVLSSAAPAFLPARQAPYMAASPGMSIMPQMMNSRFSFTQGI